jgi:hypothetical protein
METYWEILTNSSGDTDLVSHPVDENFCHAVPVQMAQSMCSLVLPRHERGRRTDRIHPLENARLKPVGFVVNLPVPVGGTAVVYELSTKRYRCSSSMHSADGDGWYHSFFAGSNRAPKCFATPRAKTAVFVRNGIFKVTRVPGVQLRLGVYRGTSRARWASSPARSDGGKKLGSVLGGFILVVLAFFVFRAVFGVRL